MNAADVNHDGYRDAVVSARGGGCDVGLWIHFGAGAFLPLDLFSDPHGWSLGFDPIPNDPTLLGNSYYAQGYWYESGCPASPLGLSSSAGLAITVMNYRVKGGAGSLRGPARGHRKTAAGVLAEDATINGRDARARRVI